MNYESIRIIQDITTQKSGIESKYPKNNTRNLQFIDTLFYIFRCANKVVDNIFPLINSPQVSIVDKNSSYLKEMNPPIENVISKKIVNHIHQKLMYVIIYTIPFLDVQDFTIYFYVYDNPTKKELGEYNNRVYIILHIIAFVLLMLRVKKLGRQRIFFFMTKIKKELPDDNSLLEQYHVNTGYTAPDKGNSDIVIYRKEEWFKVFIHEFIHNHHLDGGGMNNEFLNITKKICCINNDILISETMSELWALILNLMTISYLFKEKGLFQELVMVLPKKITKGNYYNIFWYLLNIEIYFSFLQTNKILKYLGIKYIDLFNQTNQTKKKITIHNPNTNVCSYYIIKSIYLYFYFIAFINMEKTIHHNSINIKNFEKLAKHNHIIHLLNEKIPFHINQTSLKMCALEIH